MLVIRQRAIVHRQLLGHAVLQLWVVTLLSNLPPRFPAIDRVVSVLLDLSQLRLQPLQPTTPDTRLELVQSRIDHATGALLPVFGLAPLRHSPRSVSIATIGKGLRPALALVAVHRIHGAMDARSVHRFGPSLVPVSLEPLGTVSRSISGRIVFILDVRVFRDQGKCSILSRYRPGGDKRAILFWGRDVLALS